MSIITDGAINTIKEQNKEILELYDELNILKYEAGMLRTIANRVLEEMPSNRIVYVADYTKEVLKLIENYKTEKKN